MSSAAARAEARRKAILARGNDRLAKLTTSARGEDAPGYMRDEKSLAPPHTTNLRQFVGEESPLPTPPTMSRSVSESRTSTTESGVEGLDPNTWSQEQQQLFTALLNAAGGRASAQDADALQQQQRLLSAMLTGTSTPPTMPQSRASSTPPSNTFDEDPLSALMSMASSQGGGGLPPVPNLFQQPAAAAALAPKTLVQRLLPVIHIVAAWILLAYFVLFKEPEAYENRTHGAIKPESRWARWAELARRKPDDGWGVQFVPFFWAFTTLTMVLHTWRIFRGLDPIRPPTLVSMGIMQLPPPFPSLILNFLKYLQIGSVFINDLAALLFGVGLLIWVSTWFA